MAIPNRYKWIASALVVAAAGYAQAYPHTIAAQVCNGLVAIAAALGIVSNGVQPKA